MAKSKHKHEYEDVLLTLTEMWKSSLSSSMLVKRCTVCGNFKYARMHETIKLESGFLQILTQEEILEKYKHLPHYSMPFKEFNWR